MDSASHGRVVPQDVPRQSRSDSSNQDERPQQRFAQTHTARDLIALAQRVAYCDPDDLGEMVTMARMGVGYELSRLENQQRKLAMAIEANMRAKAELQQRLMGRVGRRGGPRLRVRMPEFFSTAYESPAHRDPEEEIYEEPVIRPTFFERFPPPAALRRTDIGRQNLAATISPGAPVFHEPTDVHGHPNRIEAVSGARGSVGSFAPISGARVPREAEPTLRTRVENEPRAPIENLSTSMRPTRGDPLLAVDEDDLPFQEHPNFYQYTDPPVRHSSSSGNDGVLSAGFLALAASAALPEPDPITGIVRGQSSPVDEGQRIEEDSPLILAHQEPLARTQSQAGLVTRSAAWMDGPGNIVDALAFSRREDDERAARSRKNSDFGGPVTKKRLSRGQYTSASHQRASVPSVRMPVCRPSSSLST
jgi:hypothetical protein